MRETWYVLEDDSVVHPSEVTDEKGVLTHKNGRVAMRGDVPSTRGVEINKKTGKRAYDGPHDHLHKDWVTESDRPKPGAGKGDHERHGSTGGTKKAAKESDPSAKEPPKEEKAAPADDDRQMKAGKTKTYETR